MSLPRPPPIAVLGPTEDVDLGFLGKGRMLFKRPQGLSLGASQLALIEAFLASDVIGGERAMSELFAILVTSTIYGDATAEF